MDLDVSVDPAKLLDLHDVFLSQAQDGGEGSR